MVVIISRYDPDLSKKWEQEYEVDVSDRSMTVMDVLQVISDQQDPTLAYYRHSMCNHGICARCMMLVNGKVCLVCTELVTPYEVLHIAPIPNQAVIRDLVIHLSDGRSA